MRGANRMEMHLHQSSCKAELCLCLPLSSQLWSEGRDTAVPYLCLWLCKTLCRRAWELCSLHGAPHAVMENGWEQTCTVWSLDTKSIVPCCHSPIQALAASVLVKTVGYWLDICCIFVGSWLLVDLEGRCRHPQAGQPLRQAELSTAKHLP